MRTTRIKPHHCGQDPLVLVCGTFLYPHLTALWRSYPMCCKHLSTPEKHNYFISLCAVKPSLLYIRALKPLPHRAGERGSSGLLSAHQLRCDGILLEVFFNGVVIHLEEFLDRGAFLVFHCLAQILKVSIELKGFSGSEECILSN